MNFKEMGLNQIIYMPSFATVFLCKSVFYGKSCYHTEVMFGDYQQ